MKSDKILEGDFIMEGDYGNYVQTFVQRSHKHGLKTEKRGWITKNKPLDDSAIKAHLAKEYSVGGISPWYPQFAILVMDDMAMTLVDNVRDELGLDEDNSMLMASESADSYHCMLRPILHGKPPTEHQLRKALMPFASKNGIKAYPQSKHPVRLPFGKFSDCLDHRYSGLATWQEKLHCFNKLDDFSLSTVPGQQYEMTFTAKSPDKTLPRLVGPGNNGGGWYEQGAVLFMCGLQAPSTRHESQAKVIYYLWRQNVSYDSAVALTWDWIRKKHNGFSEDITKFPSAVKKEIQQQTTHNYTSYQWDNKYPDTCHNFYNGYICKPDIAEILNTTGGSIPESRFLFHMVKHFYPRRLRPSVPIPRGLLSAWADEQTYDSYLGELEEKGLVKRVTDCSAGEFNNGLRLDWDYTTSGDPVMHQGRSVDTFEETIKLVLAPDEFKAMLRGAGATKKVAYKSVATIYK